MKNFICCILLICAAFRLYGNVETDNLCERIYVQTDKQLYLAGEPVWMKILTTDSEQIPISFSKVAYIELVDSIARIQIKVELKNGTGEGRMQLPLDLPTRYYRLIAYTQFMRNEGPEVFFEKNIGVVNTFQSDNVPESSKPGNKFSFDEENDSGTVSLQSDKAIYTTRDHGELILTDLPKNIHTLSVSITGKELIPVAESEKSLFRKNRSAKLSKFTGEFLPEYEGHIITGKLVDNQLGIPGTDEIFLTPILSFLGEEIRFFTGQKSKTGDVLFFTSGISGTKEIATVVFHAGEEYRIDILSPFVQRHPLKQTSTLQIDSSYYPQLLARSVALQVSHYFSESLSANQNILKSYFKMKPTWSFTLDEYTRFTTMREVFVEFIVGARFRKRNGKQEISVLAKRGNNYDYGTMPLVLLDGVAISDHDIIYNYDPLVVEKINIYPGPYTLGGSLFDGIVELLTYRRLHPDLNLNKSTQIFSYEGTQPHYQFYAPDYSEAKNRQSRLPDSRHTLLWEPNVRTDGKSTVQLPFNTSDLTGEFQVTMEGITKDGDVVFTKSFFTVE